MALAMSPLTWGRLLVIGGDVAYGLGDVASACGRLVDIKGDVAYGFGEVALGRRQRHRPSPPPPPPSPLWCDAVGNKQATAYKQ